MRGGGLRLRHCGGGYVIVCERCHVDPPTTVALPGFLCDHCYADWAAVREWMRRIRVWRNPQPDFGGHSFGLRPDTFTAMLRDELVEGGRFDFTEEQLGELLRRAERRRPQRSGDLRSSPFRRW